MVILTRRAVDLYYPFSAFVHNPFPGFSGNQLHPLYASPRLATPHGSLYAPANSRDRRELIRQDGRPLG